MRAEARRIIVADRQVSSRTLTTRRAGAAGMRSRARLFVALVLGWALIYLISYVPARGNGSDFQVFYAGAYADAHGHNPFDWPQLWQVENHLYNRGGDIAHRFTFAPYGDPPPFALLLRPLTVLSEGDAYRIWAALLLLSGALGAYLCLVDWSRKARVTAALLVAVSPAALFDLRLGQNSTPLLLSFGLAISLLAARRPGWAGAALAAGLVKPHLMAPVALIVFLAAPRETRKALLGGFTIMALIEAGAGVLLDGGFAAYLAWLGSVRGFGDLIRHQPDLASVPGLYLPTASAALSGVLNLLCLGLAAAIIARLALSARRGGQPERERLLGGGIAAYLALSPYVHTSDQVLLALPLLMLIRPDGSGLRDSAVLLATVSTLLAPMVVLRDYHTVGIDALPPLCVGLAYWLRAPHTTATHSTQAVEIPSGVASHG